MFHSTLALPVLVLLLSGIHALYLPLSVPRPSLKKDETPRACETLQTLPYTLPEFIGATRMKLHVEGILKCCWIQDEEQREIKGMNKLIAAFMTILKSSIFVFELEPD